MKRKQLLLLLALLMTAATGAWAQSTPTEVSTFADLQTALSAGNDVKLTANIQFTSSIEISGSKKITIDGNGKTMSTTSAIRAFKVGSSATVAFKDLTLTGFVSGGGPAINNSGTIVLDGCTISNCHVNNSNGGGAIESSGKLYAINTTFSGNYSSEIGGAINNYGGSLYLSGCTFTNNYTTSSNAKYGGAIGNNSSNTVVIVNCTFSGNKYGGSNGSASDLGVFSTPNDYTIAGCTGITIEGATLTTYQYGTATPDYSDLSAISFTYDQSDTPIAPPAVPKHLITATYDKQTRSLEQPLPYATTVGALYEAVTGEPFSSLISTMTALENPLSGITSNNTSVVSIGEFNGASTPVTVTADGKAAVALRFGSYAQGIFVSVVPPLYVTMADGTKDADKWTVKVGDGEAQTLPIGGLKGDGSETVTLQYNGRLKVKGVKATSDAAPSVPDGALSGVFSVSDTKKVNFSKGNLQAVCTSADNNPSYPETFTWQFAENQWDYIGADNNKVNGNGSVSSNCTIDVFGWSTSSNNFGIHNSKTDGDYSGDFVDWGTAIGSGWRTLTHDEWNFLLQSRTTTSGLLFAKANLFGTVHGLILFPDNYTHPDGLAAITAPNDATGNAGWNGNQYTAEEWAKMEAAGAVFLPAAGCREGTTNHNFNVIGYYHTATPADANNSYDVAFHASVLEFDWNQPNHWAFSVRLVYDVE